MYQKMTELLKTTAYWEIPIQPGVVWDLRSGGAILSGTTGSGKSWLSLFIIIIAAIKDNILLLGDPKISDLSTLSDFMPPGNVTWQPSDICSMVENAVNIMMQRYAYMKNERLQKNLFQADFADFGYPVVLVMIDELAAFISSLDKKSRDSFEANIKRLTLQGRQSGVILCSILQNPSTTNISTESRSQAAFRVYLGQSGGIEYRMLFGEGYTYPKRIYRPGEGLYMLAGKTMKPELIQTPRLDKSQLQETLKKALKSQYDRNPLNKF